MKNKVLLDANILISALNNPKSEAAQKLKHILQDENITVFITPLIRYEVLRGIEWKDDRECQRVRERINLITSLNIEKEIADLAAELFRLEKYTRQQTGEQSKKIDKHNFDLMHFATSKVHQLAFLSDDKDIADWEKLYVQLASSKAEPA